MIKSGEVWIALQAETDGRYGIHLVRPDGTGLHVVAPRITGERQVHPDWSPDGSRLAFSVEDGDGTWDLWTVSVDGSDAERIVDCSAPCRSADHPAWSPDGRAVAFERVISSGSMSRSTLEVHDLGSGKEEVVLETLDGRGLQGPRWSPDGTRLAFEELRREPGDVDGEMSGSRIAIVELSGAEPIVSPVTDWALDAGDPDWSPAQDDLIAFTAPATPTSDRAELWTIRTDGTEPRAITDFGTGERSASDPAFTPNGRTLIFAMTRAGQAEAVMATVGLDGTGLGPATESGYLDGEHPRLRPVPGEVPPPIPSPSPPPETTPTPTPVPSPVMLEATVALSADAPADGRRRVDPGALVTITLTATALTDAPEAHAFVYVPDGWVVVEPSADEAALVAGAIRWSLGDLPAGDTIERRTVVRAPSGPATGDPAIDGLFRASLGAANGAVQAADLQLLVAPALIVEHVTFSRVHPTTHVPTYLVPDKPLTEVEAFDTFRIRFQVRNADLVPASVVPRLQYRIVGGQVFEDLPVGDPILGQPLYLAPEWRAAGNGRNGTVERSDSEAIPEGDLRSDDVDDPTQEPAAGTRFMGVEPTGSIEIDGNTYTEVELSVRATIDLPFARTVEFRLTDDGRPLMGSVSAWMATDVRPPVSLSPGQRRGLDVGPPIDATPTPGTAALSGMLDYELVTGRSAMPARAAISNAVPLYRLAVAQRTTTGQIGAMAAPGSSLHAPDTSLVSDACARCHST
ncbi:MAG: hypothetical protein OEV61_12170, partial [Chloroflexota bacterium]|nr:hypothetical protein [Chloroflexota bacterium]